MKPKFVITMLDGSVFEPHPKHLEALGNKAKDKGLKLDEEIVRLKEATKAYFERKMVMTKFGDSPWGGASAEKESYKDHADLAGEMLYQYVRAYLFAMIFQEMAKEKQMEVAPKVMVPDANSPTGLREIPGSKKKRKRDRGV